MEGEGGEGRGGEERRGEGMRGEGREGRGGKRWQLQCTGSWIIGYSICIHVHAHSVVNLGLMK